MENRLIGRDAIGQKLHRLALIPDAGRMAEHTPEARYGRLIASDIIGIGKGWIFAARQMARRSRIEANGHGETLSSDGHHTMGCHSTLAIRGQADDARIIALSIADLPRFVHFLVRQADVGGSRRESLLVWKTFRSPTGDFTALLGGIVFVRQPTLRHALDFEGSGGVIARLRGGVQ